MAHFEAKGTAGNLICMVIDSSPSVFSHTRLDTARDPSPAESELERHLKYWLLSLQVDAYSPFTLEAYQDRVGLFIGFIEKQGITKLDKIERSHVRMFLLALQQKKLAPATINAYYRAIQSFFTWQQREGSITATPLLNMQAPKVPEKTPQPASNEDIANLLLLTSGKLFYDVRNRALILLFLDTGLRLSEMTSIKLKDLNLDTGNVKVMGKGAKERTVTFGKTARASLMKYMFLREERVKEKYRDCLWITEGGKPLMRDGIRTIFKRLCQRAGITDARHGPHTLRHNFATMSIRNGANLFYVQALMGHSDLKMTRRYAKLIDSEIAGLTHYQFSPVEHLHLGK